MKMRKAVTADIEQILAITDSARQFQRQCGFRQWEDNYPAYDDIAADIAAKGAYIFENENADEDIASEAANAVECGGTANAVASADIPTVGSNTFGSEGIADIVAEAANVVECENIVAYAYLTEGDAEYDRLSHIWHYPGPCGVIHRLAIAPRFRGQGLAARIFAMSEAHLAAQGMRAMRIDTGLDNTVMQRILSRAGYTCRGPHHFTWGPRLAYEKPLPASSRRRT